jgi:hypothetical protein
MKAAPGIRSGFGHINCAAGRLAAGCLVGGGLVIGDQRRSDQDDRRSLRMNLPAITDRFSCLTTSRVTLTVDRPAKAAAPQGLACLNGMRTSASHKHWTTVAPRLRHGLFDHEEPASVAAHMRHLPVSVLPGCAILLYNHACGLRNFRNHERRRSKLAISGRVAAERERSSPQHPLPGMGFARTIPPIADSIHNDYKILISRRF